jgi:hypothetical protein
MEVAMCPNHTTKHGPNFIDLTGQRYSRLTVLREAQKPDTYQSAYVFWECRCDCGNVVVCSSGNLRSGNSKSCGCLKLEMHTARLTKHGGSYTPEFAIWNGMHKRCYSPAEPSYVNYGARGITICDRWRESFANFLADMGPLPSEHHSIDRINNDGPYSPENCRWATRKEQNNNTRRNHFLDYNGQHLTIAQWADVTGLTVDAIGLRVARGWTVERTLTAPLRITKAHRKTR